MAKQSRPMAKRPCPLHRACQGACLFFCVALANYVHFSSLVPPLSEATNKPYNEVDAALPISGGTSSPMKKGPASTVGDACVISTAMKLNPLQVSSYPYFNLSTVTIPNNRLPHVSSALCSATAQGSHTSEVRYSVNTTEPTRAVFAFKAARVGSSFFTSVITNTMRKTKRPTSMFWEPFGFPSCPQSRTYQEHALHMLLTQNCQGRRNKCHPDEHCYPMNATEYGPPISITAANPRFLSRDIHWPRIFRGVPDFRIFSLRRTDLMSMAYSKFHHSGCAMDERTLKLFNRGYKQNGTFTFDTMLLCVEHYAIGDQEISSSVAFQAVEAAGSGTRPFLVVYEDVTANSLLVQQEILRYLRLNNMDEDEDIFKNNTRMKKLHSYPFCENEDVNCDELKEGLQKYYPCLLKQLERADEKLSWSVPVLPDGTISIKGDCHPLKPLNKNHRTRSFEELYKLP